MFCGHMYISHVYLLWNAVLYMWIQNFTSGKEIKKCIIIHFYNQARTYPINIQVYTMLI